MDVKLFALVRGGDEMLLTKREQKRVATTTTDSTLGLGNRQNFFFFASVRQAKSIGEESCLGHIPATTNSAKLRNFQPGQ